MKLQSILNMMNGINLKIMNKLDKTYTDLLQDILINGVVKSDRTGTGTISIFGRQIRHKMSEGFPLLTTKKMPFKTIVTELLWFLKGDTNIKFLVDNGCHIWDGDCFSNYQKITAREIELNVAMETHPHYGLTKEEFINKIKTDDEFARQWGDLGPVYGKQWRNWREGEYTTPLGLDGPSVWKEGIDQIQNLINDLKTNPDSRRLMVNAWNVGELDQMVLPPCHYGFQVYTRELSLEERCNEYIKRHPKETNDGVLNYKWIGDNLCTHKDYDKWNIPTRAISLMWNQRSVDTFLGLPFNIASYGLLLEIIAKAVNMIPDELIGNLGDVHLYSNHVEQAKEQIGREYSIDERLDLLYKIKPDFNAPIEFGIASHINSYCNSIIDEYGIDRRTRTPFKLPVLNINTEFWPKETEDGPLDAIAIVNGFSDDNFCKCLLEEDIQLSNYKSHPTIKAPLSN
jgi:thymidylate synthase